MRRDAVNVIAMLSLRQLQQFLAPSPTPRASSRPRRALRVVTPQGATHYVHLDRPQHGREQLLQEVVSFLTN
ncbi:hypothetical protein [Bradyrhizobium sp. ORS 86]|uniref:hypothetical protein n=1 Tax=Bradyrhizobium sp. ORS 86 TaxID=1685970 RepID=UPI00388D115D